MIKNLHPATFHILPLQDLLIRFPEIRSLHGSRLLGHGIHVHAGHEVEFVEAHVGLFGFGAAGVGHRVQGALGHGGGSTGAHVALGAGAEGPGGFGVGLGEEVRDGGTVGVFGRGVGLVLFSSCSWQSDGGEGDLQKFDSKFTFMVSRISLVVSWLIGVPP